MNTKGFSKFSFVNLSALVVGNQRFLSSLGMTAWGSRLAYAAIQIALGPVFCSP